MVGQSLKGIGGSCVPWEVGFACGGISCSPRGDGSLSVRKDSWCGGLGGNGCGESTGG